MPNMETDLPVRFYSLVTLALFQTSTKRKGILQKRKGRQIQLQVTKRLEAQ